MGNRHSSTVINASSTALTAVSQAFLALSQDISQSTLGSQTIIVNCAGDKKQKYCDQCEAFWATHNKNTSNTTVSPADIGTLCAPICQCILSNVDLSQHIKVNLSAFANNYTSDAFITQVNNSINQQAYDSGSSIFPSSSTTSNMNQSVEQIYQGMQSDSFQTQIQGLLSLQTVSLTGAGNIAYVTLN